MRRPAARQSARLRHRARRRRVGVLVTPIAYQTNMIVYGMGGYRFRDFSRLGLLLATYLVALATIPVFFPLR